MKLYAAIAGLFLGLATLALAQHYQLHTTTAAGIPIPLCPPDQPNCNLNQ
jgi:hypothetical protein